MPAFKLCVCVRIPILTTMSCFSPFLQKLAETYPGPVGSRMLPTVLDALRHDLAEEEMSEILELVQNLVQTSDAQAAIANTQIIIEETGTVTNLLDLLTYDSFSVIATALQILSRVHAVSFPTHFPMFFVDEIGRAHV